MVKVIARLLRRTLLVLGGLLLGVSVYLGIAQGILGNPMPMPFGIGTAVVLSGSMEPTLHVDDLLIVRQTKEVGVGDVIVYQAGPHLVVHRIVWMEGQRIVTRGDANNTNDEPITTEVVKGVVIKSYPGAGEWLRALRTPGGILVVLLLVFLLPELIYGLERREEAKQNTEAMKEEIRKLRAMSDEDGNEGGG